jgi:hypothetical protein
MRNRWYDPDLGRFISADPGGFPDGPNAYAFAGNTPVNKGDPLGLFALDVHRRLTTEALVSAGLSARLVKRVNSGHWLADYPNQMVSEQHFDNNSFVEGVLLIDQLLDIAKHSPDAADAARALGRAIHASQDFYAHSNYVELTAGGSLAGLPAGQLPLWDFRASKAGVQPNGLASGRFGVAPGVTCKITKRSQIGSSARMPANRPRTTARTASTRTRPWGPRPALSTHRVRPVIKSPPRWRSGKHSRFSLT